MKIITKKRSSQVLQAVRWVALLSLSGMAVTAVANPVLGDVGAGQVSIQQTAQTTTINQSSSQAILNWQSFNIGSQESTRFIQPTGGVALNRIDPTAGVSQIYGSLSATGRIILVNPAGIYFGPGSVVNVGGIIATTSNITDQNFLNGNYQFANTSNYEGSVVNNGSIYAAKNGLVALVGSNVTNNGLIQANLGHVVLAAGDAYTMSFAGDDLINFAITKPSQHPNVTNNGSLIANGGQILVTAAAAQGTLDNIINMNGVAQAKSVYKHNGEIVISGTGGGGVVKISGKLLASGRGHHHHHRTGGTVDVTGYDILLDSTSLIDVSGDAGGGTVNIGGNEHGAGPLPNANAVVMAPGATILANAIVSGNGGNVVLWSENVTKAYGNIELQGGPQGGNGGFLETSSHHYLDINGLSVDTLAAKGTTGTWLLDPTDLEIETGSGNNGIATSFNGGTNTTTDTATLGFGSPGGPSVLDTNTLDPQLASTNVLLQTTADPSVAGSGEILVLSNILWSSASSLTLSAYNSISLLASITNTNPLAALTLIANNAGVFDSSSGNGVVVQNIGPTSINMAGLVKIYTNGNFGYPSASPYANTGPGAVSTYFFINDAADLSSLSTTSAAFNNNYLLNNTINASAIGVYAGIGNSTTAFTGTFNGIGYNGTQYAINNLPITSPAPGQADIGLFGVTGASALIQNLQVNNATINDSGTSANNVGILVGNNAGTLLNDATSGSVLGGSEAGGLVGFNSGTIENSFSTATVTGADAVGGLIGQNASGAILENLNYSGTVTGTNSVGGLIGENGGVVNGQNNLTLMATVGATGTDGGGFIGTNDVGGLVENLTATPADLTLNFGGATISGGVVGVNNGTLLNVENTGVPITSFGVVGGIAGENGGTISNAINYANLQVLPAVGFVFGVGGIVGEASAGSSVTNGINYGTITSTNATQVAGTGGIVGYNGGSIISSLNVGNVNGDTDVGGIAGFNDNQTGGDTGSINNSTNRGTISGVDVVGSIAGLDTAPISNSLAIGTVSANDNFGDIVGELSNTTAAAVLSNNTDLNLSLIGLPGNNYIRIFANQISPAIPIVGYSAGNNTLDLTNYLTGAVTAALSSNVNAGTLRLNTNQNLIGNFSNIDILIGNPNFNNIIRITAQEAKNFRSTGPRSGIISDPLFFFNFVVLANQQAPATVNVTQPENDHYTYTSLPEWIVFGPNNYDIVGNLDRPNIFETASIDTFGLPTITEPYYELGGYIIPQDTDSIIYQLFQDYKVPINKIRIHPNCTGGAGIDCGAGLPAGAADAGAGEGTGLSASGGAPGSGSGIGVGDVYRGCVIYHDMHGLSRVSCDSFLAPMHAAAVKK